MSIENQAEHLGKNEDLSKHDYMLLSRYQQDLDYFFGYGGRDEKHLYYSTFKEHMVETRKLWNSLEVKPDWFSEMELDEYENLYNTPAPANETEKEYLAYMKRLSS